MKRSDKNRDEELAEVEGFSFNVAWSHEEDKAEAEEKYNNLQEDAGYKIDYSDFN